MKTVVDNFTSRWNPISPVGFFEKNNQGKQDTFTTAIALFSKETGISGRTGRCGKNGFRKKWALY